ncbi:hypothetical protein ACIBQ0_09430 [Nocardia nova]|uniref:hypothetical protein n=1 Tax=Nocardia nova TaxID=37330 RepID=UPI0037A2476E
MVVSRAGEWTTHPEQQPEHPTQPLRYPLRITRNGALADLAADLPAAVLADLLGIHVTAAILWVKRSQRDWADYLAARRADQSDPE